VGATTVSSFDDLRVVSVRAVLVLPWLADVLTDDDVFSLSTSVDFEGVKDFRAGRLARSNAEVFSRFDVLSTDCYTL